MLWIAEQGKGLVSLLWECMLLYLAEVCLMLHNFKITLELLHEQKMSGIIGYRWIMCCGDCDDDDVSSSKIIETQGGEMGGSRGECKRHKTTHTHAHAHKHTHLFTPNNSARRNAETRNPGQHFHTSRAKWGPPEIGRVTTQKHTDSVTRRFSAKIMYCVLKIICI